jgi:hypothetical protein
MAMMGPKDEFTAGYLPLPKELLMRSTSEATCFSVSGPL